MPDLPGQRARANIDAILPAAGLAFQDYKGFNPSASKMLAISLPYSAEQPRIVGEVQRWLSVVDELDSVVLADLQRGIRLRQARLQKAFTGGFTS